MDQLLKITYQSSPLAAAPIQNPLVNASLRGVSGVEFVSRLISALITFLLVVGVIFFVFNFILGAIDWMRSGGDKAKYEASRDKITNSIVGLVIMLSLYAIISLIEYFFQIRITVFNVDDFTI